MLEESSKGKHTRDQRLLNKAWKTGGSGRGPSHQAAAFKLRFVHIDQLILVEAAVDHEIKEGDGRHERLNQAEHQAQQDCDTAIGDLPPIVNVLLLPQPGFCTLCVRHPRLNVQKDEPCRKAFFINGIWSHAFKLQNKQ